MLVGKLPDDEEADCHHGDNRQDDNFLRGEPVQFFAAVEHNLQTADTNDQQRQTNSVDTPLLGFGFPTSQGLQRHQYHYSTDWHVDEKYPAPVIVVADIAPKNGATYRGNNHRHRPEREGNGAFGGRIVIQ